MSPFYELLTLPGTTLKRLEEDGWRIESNGYTIYFRHQETRAVQAIPAWAQEFAVSQARTAIEARLKQIHELLDPKL